MFRFAVRTTFFAAALAVLSSGSAFAQCTDAWVTQAVKAVKGTINGSANTGDCYIGNYGGGHWSSYADLLAKVKAHFPPAPPPPPAKPAPPPPPPPAKPAPPPPPPPQPTGPLQVRLMTPDNQCLGVELGSRGQKARIIRWACTSAPDQAFTFYSDGTIRTFSGMCLDDLGGTGKQMDQIVTWPCNVPVTTGQHWTLQNFALKNGFNGMCLNIRGGVYVGNADTLLYQCNGQSNEQFHWGIYYPAPTPAQLAAPHIIAGVSSSSGSIVAQGAGNIVAQGAGNIVAQGAGNMVPK